MTDILGNNGPVRPLGSGADGAGKGILASTVFAVTARALRDARKGRITLILPNGAQRTFGGSAPGAEAVLVVRSPRVLTKSLMRGTIGFGESYLAGDWDSPDLGEVFRFFVDNKPALVSGSRGIFRVRLPDALAHRRNGNTKAGSRRNIAFHYDLGNTFYAAWLDRTMTYSSALYRSGDESLEEAQKRKYQAVLDALDVHAGDRVLEIGCGWGGFAETAAGAHGVSVDGVTLSHEQLAFAQARLAGAGLASRTDLALRDYRDTSGHYDGVASIEMIEAVGAEHWDTYFRTIRDRLKAGARAAIQAITIDDALYPTYARRPDFIQRYIFPGGALPTKDLMVQHAEGAGLRFVGAQHFADSYARTLWAWRERFLDRWSEISALGFDERFRRMWDYYLTYCAVGFEKRTIDVGIYVFEAPDTLRPNGQGSA